MGGNKCSVCQSSAENLKICGGCKSVWYCGVDHQKQHWKQHKSDCTPFEIASSDELGNFLRAKRNIPVNGQILSELPLVFAALSNVSGSTETGPCVGCFEPLQIGPNTARCRGCGCFACRPDCAGLSTVQLHGAECELFKNFGIGDKAYLRIYKNDGLLLFKSFLLQIINKKKWQTMMTLQSHEVDRKSTQNYEDAQEIVNFIDAQFVSKIKVFEQKIGKKLFAHTDQSVLHKLCGIIEVNAMTVSLSNGTELSALFPTARYMAHSCMPNCYYTFDKNQGFKICVQAARDLLKGECLNTMYTHMLWGTVARRDHLLATKYFECKCERCADPTELGTYFSGLKCLGPDDGPSCEGIVLPVDPLVTNTAWACNICRIPITNTGEIGAMIDGIGYELEEARNPKTITVKGLEELHDKLSFVLHPNHYHMFNLKHSLIQTYGHQADYTHEKMTNAQLTRKVAMCHELMAVLFVLDPYSIRLALYTSITLHEQCRAEIELQKRELKQDSSTGGKQKVAAKMQELLGILQRSKEIIRNELDLPQGLVCDRSIDKTIDDLEREIGNL